ncbi:MAG: hypothetical protein OEZ22_14885 [Spirochaetia bacterium]|nr:hypothetical protein [Spirochaetia bacterium]
MADYMNQAFDKLQNMRDGFGVRSEKDLPYAPMIPVLTALLKLSDESNNKSACNKKIQIWYWSSIFTTSYSSGADTQMTIDFKEMKIWFSNDELLPKVVINFRKNIPLLEFTDIQSTSNAKYKGILSLIALKGAKDFNTNLHLENSKENDKDHIFPKSMKGLNEKYVNSILNMTWMSDETNRNIKRFKSPSKYIKEFIADKYGNNENKFKAVLNTHFIDNAAFNAMQSDNFENFLNHRSDNIIKYLLEITDSAKISQKSKTLIASNTPFSNRFAFMDTLNQCSEYIYWLDKYFSIKGLEYLNISIAPTQVKEIRIIMSLDKVDDTFRKYFKDFRSEFKTKGIEVNLNVITDSKIKSSIHDRYIITKDIAFNIPSPDIIARNQLSEITISPNFDSLKQVFNDVWNNSLDIINSWNDILKNMNK